MELTDLLGYFAALLIGVVLGLIGGGGSILTVPVMVYLLSVNPVTATAYSLFVVGTSSFVGAIKNFRRGRVKFRTAVAFAIPAFIAVFSTRKFLVPWIPEVIFSNESFTLTKGTAIMLFFAVLMLAASLSMILGSKEKDSTSEAKSDPNYALLMPLGLLTGLVTGLVGAGGGFIIVPILVLLAGLPMKTAVGTSLFIVSVNSLIGFLGDLGHQEIDWVFLLVFSVLAIGGIYLGFILGKFINGPRLKKGFGWFIFFMGIYIFWKEIF